MNRHELIDAVMAEIDRIWGPEGFGGEAEQYTWLLTYYGISEEEDLQWQLIIDDGEAEAADSGLYVADLHDDAAVCAFLSNLLTKYRNNTMTYTGWGAR